MSAESQRQLIERLRGQPTSDSAAATGPRLITPAVLKRVLDWVERA